MTKKCRKHVLVPQCVCVCVYVCVFSATILTQNVVLCDEKYLCVTFVRHTLSCCEPQVLQEASDLLMKPEEVDPNCDNSLRSWLSELKRVNPNEYFANAAACTKEHASKDLQAAIADLALAS